MSRYKAIQIQIDFWVSQPFETGVAQKKTQKEKSIQTTVRAKRSDLHEKNPFSGVVGKQPIQWHCPKPVIFMPQIPSALLKSNELLPCRTSPKQKNPQGETEQHNDNIMVHDIHNQTRCFYGLSIKKVKRKRFNASRDRGLSNG